MARANLLPRLYGICTALKQATQANVCRTMQAGMLLAATLLATTDAYAGSAEQLVGLFIQGCVPFAGNPSGLREWARRTGLPPVPEQASKAFLHGAPGQAFDGSATATKLVLVSSDDGICSAATNQAVQQQVAEALQAGFRQAGLAFRLVIERDDAHIPLIHDREYLAARDKRAWRILVATVKDDQGGEAMLTAALE